MEGNKVSTMGEENFTIADKVNVYMVETCRNKAAVAKKGWAATENPRCDAP